MFFCMNLILVWALWEVEARAITAMVETEELWRIKAFHPRWSIYHIDKKIIHLWPFAYSWAFHLWKLASVKIVSLQIKQKLVPTLSKSIRYINHMHVCCVQTGIINALGVIFCEVQFLVSSHLVDLAKKISWRSPEGRSWPEI